jgi:hypothetical protein
MAIFNMTGRGDVSDIKTFGSSHIKIVDVCLNYLSRGWDSYNDDLVETSITPSELAPHDYGLLVISSADKMYGEKDAFGNGTTEYVNKVLYIPMKLFIFE